MVHNLGYHDRADLWVIIRPVGGDHHWNKVEAVRTFLIVSPERYISLRGAKVFLRPEAHQNARSGGTQIHLVPILAQRKGCNSPRVTAQFPESQVLVEDQIALGIDLHPRRYLVLDQIGRTIAKIPLANIDLRIGCVIQLNPVHSQGVRMCQNLVNHHVAGIRDNTAIVPTGRAERVRTWTPGTLIVPAFCRIGRHQKLVFAQRPVVHANIVDKAVPIHPSIMIVANMALMVHTRIAGRRNAAL